MRRVIPFPVGRLPVTRRNLVEDRTALLAVIILAMAGFSMFFWSYTVSSGMWAVLGIVGGVALVIGSLTFGLMRLNESS